jgi:hypothetical protein
MSLLIKAGISKLSELEIDADKDWQTKGISNIKEIVQGMSIGDVAQHDGATLVKLSPGQAHHVLTSEGPGKLVVWAPGGTYFYRYFPVTVYLTHSQAKVSPDKSHGKNIAVSTWNRQAHADAPADFIKRLTPSIALADAEAIMAPDKTGDESAPVTTTLVLKKAIDGAAADDGGAQTEETAAAQNPAANDMTLLPAAPAVNDAYYFGFSRPWDLLWLNVGTAGVGTWTLTWEYWNGTAWTALADVVDDTITFTMAGTKKVGFTRPGDWVSTTILAMNLYWIRARVSNFTGMTTQPLGTQAWCEAAV